MSENGNRSGGPGASARGSWLGRFAGANRLAIGFITVALCLGGAYAASRMPSSVFPQTDFPRVVVLVDNGVMPADEMMATITRPIEEAMKDIPGTVTVRSSTGRGSAEVNVFFNWQVDMVESELYVNSRLAQLRAQLPATATATVWRLTFAAFPIIGVSLTGQQRKSTELWDIARYELKPRFLRIPGVARVDLVGGRRREYHVVVEPTRLAASGLSLAELTDALERNNLIASTGMHEENHRLYLTVVDGRLTGPAEIAELTVPAGAGTPVRLGDLGRVEEGAEPAFNVVTADGVPAVLLNIRSQPDGSTLDIADQLAVEIRRLRQEMPADLHLAYFYDQSLLVRASVGSVWEAILIGLALAVVVLYLFLRHWGSTVTAALAIPITVAITLVPMRAAGLSFNLMTLGGIAAAIGLVIDDAIVVVEAIYTKVAAGARRIEAIRSAIGEIARPLVGSTLTPVVVFLPLAFLQGITGVFFRALAITMVVALLTSLLLAVTLMPTLAAVLVRESEDPDATSSDAGTVRRIAAGYERAVLAALGSPGLALLVCALLLLVGIGLYRRLDSEFLPPMDEGGFVIDYHSPWGTSLEETDRQLQQAEAIIRAHPDIESYSRRTGARLALAIAEPNTGDFLVKLKPDREHTTDEVIADLRQRFLRAVPGLQWEFPGILSDLIGDLTWSPNPIEVKLFSPDVDFLKQKAPQVKEQLDRIPGVVDTFDGLVYTGPTIALKVRTPDAERVGLTADDLATAVNVAMLGRMASYVLEGDRVVNIRVRADSDYLRRVDTLRDLPVRTPSGALVEVEQVADVVIEPGQLELRREDLRQDVAVTARLENRDLGSAMDEVRRRLSGDPSLPPGVIEFGGLYEQQQESLRSLTVVLAAAIFLVFTVLLIEFRSFAEPLAIVFGAVLSMFGTVAALWLTGTSFNVVSFLGTIIGVGIVAKNGILMLDTVEHHRQYGAPLVEAIVESGRRRLRPVLMTSLTTFLAMLPLAWGVGSGADMLQPLAVAIMGALTFSVALALLATPAAYLMIQRIRGHAS